MASSDDDTDFSQIYPWITAEFFQNILRRDQNNPKIIVKNVVLKAAIGKGENYTSQLLRAKVEYSTGGSGVEKISFIVKAAVAHNPELVAMVEEMGLFRKEIIVYQKILPEVEKLLKSIGDNTKMSAKCYDANLEESYFVFEDLSEIGYENVNRRTGIDVEHYKHLLSKVAKWHAATAVLVAKNPSMADGLLEQQLNTKSQQWRSVIINSTTTIADATATIPGYEKLSKKLNKLHGTIFERICAVARRQDNEFNVLCHGDMWANNIMFSHDARGRAVEAMLIDFQIVSLASPILDIVYTLYTSSNNQLREADWDHLIQHYHDVLKSTLELLKYPKRIPTLTELHIEILRKGICGAFIGLLVVGIRNLEDVEDGAITRFLSEGNESDRAYRLKMILQPECRASLDFLLEFFDRKGYFD